MASEDPFLVMPWSSDFPIQEAYSTFQQYPLFRSSRNDSLTFGQYNINESEVTSLRSLGAINLPEARAATNLAFETERTFFGSDSNQNGNADAFRHSFWAGTLARRLGEQWATSYTRNHERGNPNEVIAKLMEFMDLWNNDLGIRLARQNPNVSDLEFARIIYDSILAGYGVRLVGGDKRIEQVDRAYVNTLNGLGANAIVPTGR
jgi:hypothetical protein